MIKKLIPFGLLVTALVSSSAFAQSTTQANSTQLDSSNMNHLFYTPTVRVNAKDEITASFHEVAYGLGNGLHVQFSLFDNIGRTNFGIKYQLSDSFVVGAGLGSTFASLPQGNHGIHDRGDQRIAVYLTSQVARNEKADIFFTGHAQVGEVASVGLDLGINFKQADNFNVILEGGSSYDTNSQLLYMNADGGLRIFLSELERTYIDLGIDLYDFTVNSDYNPGPQGVKMYLDFGYHF